jgi:hypothetical protein
MGERRASAPIPILNYRGKYLILKLAKRPKISECSLVRQENWSDFDSAIPWFESRRPSGPVSPFLAISGLLVERATNPWLSAASSGLCG